MSNPLSTMNSLDNTYVGRFAPSPSGPLHFGSLVSALGSFLQARSQGGKWLLRIEDLDPPREVPGASEAIIRCLEAHHLYWDDDIVYQSQRSDLYTQHIDRLTEQGLTYNCCCTRAQLASLETGQSCRCVNQNFKSKNNAVRFVFANDRRSFDDQLLGRIKAPQGETARQFALKRKDGLFAYQLAVVVDDIQQGITEVARGADLLTATFFQLALYDAFNFRAPKFLHFPVVASQPGKKLSKQNRASAVSPKNVCSNLVNALEFLGFPEARAHHRDSAQNILDWAISAWDLHQIPAKTECIDNRIEQADSI